MGLFDKIKEPIFLKEDSSLTAQLSLLEGLLKTAPPDATKKIEQELRNVRAGLIGEQQIAFELKNSHLPLYVLHDLYLEFDGLAVQIDYLVITRRRTFVLECKNLYGDIEITSQGDFIRCFNYGEKTFKERIYSPITQNERHLALIKQIRAAQRSNLLSQALFEKYFSNNYRSAIVLANPKTILSDNRSNRNVDAPVVSVDRLIAHIKRVNSEKGADDCSERDMTAQAYFFLQLDKPNPDYVPQYLKKFGLPASAAPPALRPPAPRHPARAEAPSSPQQPLCPRCGAPMVLRTAKKGDNAGHSFYGCSRYPSCRGIVNAKT